MSALYDSRRVGPLGHVVLAQFSALGQAARIVGIIDQTDGEELASVL